MSKNIKKISLLVISLCAVLGISFLISGCSNGSDATNTTATNTKVDIPHSDYYNTSGAKIDESVIKGVADKNSAKYKDMNSDYATTTGWDELNKLGVQHYVIYNFNNSSSNNMQIHANWPDSKKASLDSEYESALKTYKDYKNETDKKKVKVEYEKETNDSYVIIWTQTTTTSSGEDYTSRCIACCSREGQADIKVSQHEVSSGKKYTENISEDSSLSAWMQILGDLGIKAAQL